MSFKFIAQLWDSGHVVAANCEGLVAGVTIFVIIFNLFLLLCYMLFLFPCLVSYSFKDLVTVPQEYYSNQTAAIRLRIINIINTLV